MKKILIVGANSAIAAAAARLLAARGADLFLLARDSERLDALARDLTVRGASSVGFAVFDANDFGRHAGLVEQAATAMGGLDAVLVAHGTLGDQKACEADFGRTLAELNTNGVSVISLLTHIANRFEAQRSGKIAVIGSVAGDRGRQSNYVYGTAKAMVATFLQGLRNRLHPANVQVLTVKPGFVDTPMTAAFKKGALWAKPEAVAAAIVGAMDSGRNTLYTPWFWWGIMAIIRSIPETIFKKLKL